MCVSLGACGAELDGFQEGVWVKVGTAELREADLQSQSEELDPYGQRRFRGPEGKRSLLAAVTLRELLRQSASAEGYGEDLRASWTVIEEAASLQMAAELERVFPHTQLEGEADALRRRYEQGLAQREAFLLLPERRTFKGLRLTMWEDAERAIAVVQGGDKKLEELGELFTTLPQSRNDEKYPSFHRILFDPDLKQGDLLKLPVISDGVLLVGRLEKIDGAGPKPFEDPEVQSWLRDALYREQSPEYRAKITATIASRFPVRESR